MVGYKVNAESTMNQYYQFDVGLSFCMVGGKDAVLVVIPYQ